MDDEDATLTLASPAGMLRHVLKAHSVHPVDLTYATLDKLGQPLDPPHILATYQAIVAVVTWMTRTNARPGVDARNTLDAVTHLNLADQPIQVRDVAATTVTQLLSWIWGDDICTTTGRRQHIAQHLHYPWTTKDGYPTDPYTRTLM